WCSCPPPCAAARHSTSDSSAHETCGISMAHDDPMAELTVTALRVVQAVVATGSFTAAADLLGYTQSGVSRQVAAAEAAAGVPLFVRGARGVAATPAGERVARRAAAALAEIDAVPTDLARLADRLA